MVYDHYEYYRRLCGQNILFFYFGEISQSLIVELAALLEQRIESAAASRKVFSFVTEMAQNVIHYASGENDHNQCDPECRFGVLTVGRERDEYFIICGNLVKTADKKRLQRRLEALSDLDTEALKAKYREQRKKGPEPGSKGAGLGFLDMAKKCRGNLAYEFRKVDDRFYFFSVKAIVA